MNCKKNCLSYITAYVNANKKSCILDNCWKHVENALKSALVSHAAYHSHFGSFCPTVRSQEPTYIPGWSHQSSKAFCSRAQPSCLLIFYVLHCLQLLKWFVHTLDAFACNTCVNKSQHARYM